MNTQDLKIRIGIDADTGKLKVLTSEFDNLGNSIEKAGKSVEDLNVSFSTMAKGFVVMKVIEGFASVIDAVRTASQSVTEFNHKMLEVSTLSNATASDMARLSKAALELKAPFANLDIAQALYDAQSAGVAFGDSLAFVATASKLAIAGNASLKDASDMLTSSINAYADSTDNAYKYSEALFTAVKQGKTTVTELGGSIGMVAPVAKAAGVSFDELAMTIATMTASGIKTNTAIEYTRGALSNVIKPSDEAKKLAKELGIEFSTTAIKAQGFANWLETVRAKTGNSSDAMGKLFGDVGALAGILSITDAGWQKYQANMDAVAHKTGVVDVATEKMSHSTKFAAMELDKNWSSLMATIKGDESVYHAGLDAMNSALKFGITNSDNLGTALKSVAAFTITGGVIATGVSIWASYTLAVDGATAATGRLGVALNFLKAHPVILALSVLSAGAVWGHEQYKQKQKELDLVSATMKDTKASIEDINTALVSSYNRYKDMGEDSRYSPQQRRAKQADIQKEIDLLAKQAGVYGDVANALGIKTQKEKTDAENAKKGLAETAEKASALAKADKGNDKAKKLAEDMAKTLDKTYTDINKSYISGLDEKLYSEKIAYAKEYEALKGNESAKYALKASYLKKVDELKGDYALKLEETDATSLTNYNESLARMKKFEEEAYKEKTKWVDELMGYIGKGLDSQIFDALTGKFKSFKNWWKDFWDSMWKASAQGIARYLSGTLTDTLGNAVKSALGGGSSSNGGLNVAKLFGGGIGGSTDTLTTLFNTAKQTYEGTLTKDGYDTAATPEAKAAMDAALSNLNAASSLSSLYTMASNGISSGIINSFATVNQGIGSVMGSLNMSAETIAATQGAISNFSLGIANPTTSMGMNGAYGTAGAVGGALVAGVGGYALGSLGDAAFGTKTQAANFGAMGAAIGSIGGIGGAIAGAVIGSLIGGAMGSTKTTGSGLENINATSKSVNGNAYEDSTYSNWFMSSDKHSTKELSTQQTKAIREVMTAYETVLRGFGNMQTLQMTGRFNDVADFANWTGQAFLTKVMGLGALTKEIEMQAIEWDGAISNAYSYIATVSTDDGAKLNEVYQAWTDYATQQKITVTEALTGVFSTANAFMNNADIFAIDNSGGSSLALKAKLANETLSITENAIGVFGETITTFTGDMKKAIANTATPETITNWTNLGTALQNAATAAKALQGATDSFYATIYGLTGATNTFVQNGQEWTLPTVGGTKDDLAKYLQDNKAFFTDNQALMNAVISYNTSQDAQTTGYQQKALSLAQSQISALKGILSGISQLEQIQRDLYTNADLSPLGIADRLTNTMGYITQEQSKAAIELLSGNTAGFNASVSQLQSYAQSYLQDAKAFSTSNEEYAAYFAKIQNILGSFSVSSIKDPLTTELQRLTSIETTLLGQLNQTATSLESILKNIATAVSNGAINNTKLPTSQVAGFSSVATNNVATQIGANTIYKDVLGATVSAATSDFQANNFNITLLGGNAISAYDAGAALYNTVQTGGADAAYALAAQNGVSAEAALYLYNQYAAKMDGSHATGLDYVPFDGYRAELHKGERVLTASEAKRQDGLSSTDIAPLILRLLTEIKQMNGNFDRVIDRSDTGVDALLTRSA